MTAVATLTAACTTTPSPVDAVASPNFQARLSDVGGNVEGGYVPFVNGAVQGDGTILTTLGNVPEGVTACLRRGESWAEIGAEGACASGEEVSP